MLDWSLITREPVNRAENKGIIFEDLIEKLLVAMFPRETWRRTIKSHDGKRDFVYPDNEILPDQKWAECKNYTSNISLNVIAPTLIMGAIESISTILFFSYSSLNDNDIENILRYAVFTGKVVKIYDGSLLESLICKYHNTQGICNYFPDTDFNSISEKLRENPLRVIRVIRGVDERNLSPSHLFELGEPFYISIIIQNLLLCQTDYKITIKQSKNNSLSFSNCTTLDSVPGASIKEHIINCQALTPGNTTYAAKLLIANNKSGNCEIRGKIKIADEPYLFWSGKHALNAQDIAMKHLTSYQTTPLLIAGNSGTGKSTLIDILLQDPSVRAKYNVLRLDLNQSRNCCVQSLLSQMIGMHGTDSTPKEQIEDEQMTLNFLTNTYAESAHSIAKILFQFYDQEKPYLIVIDDIQKIGRAYIDLVNEMDTLATERKAQIYYLFALNESMASKESVLARLNWDATYKNRTCKIVELHEFDKEDILAFMKHKFGLTGIDRFFSDFNSCVRPIELRSFCTNLKMDNIISPYYAPSGSRMIYQIVDEFRFAETVNNVLYTQRSIHVILDLLTNSDVHLYVLKYLYIVEEISPSFRKKYQHQINDLISLGLLKEANERIIFYHDEIRKCVNHCLTFLEEDYADIFGEKNVDNASKAICALHQIGRIRGGVAFLQKFFNANLEIAKVNQRYELCQLIFENFGGITEFGLTCDALRFVRFNFDALNNEIGYLTSFHFLRLVADTALSGHWDTCEECVENMAYFIKKYFDRSLTNHDHRQCLDFYLKFDALFHKITCITPQRRDYWLSHYTNRLAIMFDRDSVPLETEPSSAAKYYLQSYAYCISAGRPNDLLLQTCVDDFNRHYVYRHDLTLDVIEKTHDKLVNIERNRVSSAALLDYHLLLLEYLNTKLRDTNFFDDLLSRIKNVRKSCRSSFYKLKLYILEIYTLMELQRYQEADSLLYHAFALAYKSELRPHIYKLTYIQAHLQIFQNGGSVSDNSFRQVVLAFEQLMDVHGGSSYDLKREIYLIMRLTSIIDLSDPKKVASVFKKKNVEVQLLFQELCSHISASNNSLFMMKSYFQYNDINFPLI